MVCYLYSRMVRGFLTMVVVGVSTACGANTATQEPVRESPSHAESIAPGAIAVPENPADRSIRRQLQLAISQDDELKHREISFIVSNGGDVNVTGTVRTEEERKKITDLAMNISGVKSVANGLRVAE